MAAGARPVLASFLQLLAVGSSWHASFRGVQHRHHSIYDDATPGLTCGDFMEAINVGFGASFPNASSYRGIFASRLRSCSMGSTETVTFERTLEQRKPAAEKLQKPIAFFHTSKTGGTFFCQCAHHIGFNKGLPDGKGKNCHYLHEDRPTWGFHDVDAVETAEERDVHTSSCEALAKMYKSKGVDVEGNEGYMRSEGMCPQFTNVAFIRAPMNRLVSHLMELMSYYKGDSEKLVMNETVDSLVEKWPIVTNNYVTRTMGGYDVFSRPLGEVTESDLAVAKARLHELDYIFLVDETLTDQLEQGLGWDCSDAVGRESSAAGGSKSFLRRLKKHFGESDWQRLLDLNALDMELFQEARLLKFVLGDSGPKP